MLSAIILRRGKVGVYLQKLIKELRSAFYPYCAINLKEKRKNSLKDFLSIVDVYGLSHMLAVTNSEKNSYLKIAKMPSGPTITYKINKYCFSSDINKDATTKKPLSKIFNQIPVVILNNFNTNLEFFGNEEPLKICSSMFQSLFPPLNFNEIDTNKLKRAFLVNLNIDEGKPVFQMRLFDIDVIKASSKKTIANIINSKITDFSKFDNIADYVLKHSGYTDNSDNEGEDNNINLNLKEANNENGKKFNKIKLTEVGPRIDLSLVKIEEGFFKGNIAYHEFVKKSKKDIFENAKALKEKNKLKRIRANEQKKNVNLKTKSNEEDENENPNEFANNNSTEEQDYQNGKNENDNYRDKKVKHEKKYDNEKFDKPQKTKTFNKNDKSNNHKNEKVYDNENPKNNKISLLNKKRKNEK